MSEFVVLMSQQARSKRYRMGTAVEWQPSRTDDSRGCRLANQMIMSWRAISVAEMALAIPYRIIACKCQPMKAARLLWLPQTSRLIEADVKSVAPRSMGTQSRNCFSCSGLRTGVDRKWGLESQIIYSPRFSRLRQLQGRFIIIAASIESVRVRVRVRVGVGITCRVSSARYG